MSPYTVKNDGTGVPIVVPNKMLVFAPHPDDELLSCGGTILKYSKLGTEIVVVLMTQGLGGYAKAEERERIATIREQEYLNATRDLRVTKVITLRFDDVVINRENVKLVTTLIREHQPDIILAPHKSDTHRAHRATALLVKEAVYHAVHGKAYGGHEKNVLPKGYYCYESPSCKFSYINADVFCVVDISAQWTEKVEIFNKAYASQGEVLERIITWSEKTCKLRGEEIFTEFGEAFIPDTEYVPLSILIV